MENKGRILWVDDEIEVLKPHIILLEKRKYQVKTASNGEDAIELIRKFPFDLVFLDENMVGLSGLETLNHIKQLDSSLPVVMVTKNEAEEMMEDAIASKVDDYLTKPVNPAQILLACKKFLEAKRIESEKFTQDYFKNFNQISQTLMGPTNWNDWVEIYKKLTKYSIESENIDEPALHDTLETQWRDANITFSKYVEENYINWINMKKGEQEPYLSPHVSDKWLRPMLEEADGPVFFFLIDCLRYDQWLIMEQLLSDYFSIDVDFHCAILPTVTAYCRNSIFAGLYPIDIKKYFPDYWKVENAADEHSQNKYERELLETWVERRRIKLNKPPNFIKIFQTDFGQKVEKDILNHKNADLTTIVINAVDMIAHSRSDYAILKEIAPDEAAYRSLTKSWFTHSSLFGMLKQISTIKNAKILLTTDHGAVRCLHGVKAFGDRDTSTSLRYKFGKNVKADPKDAMQIENLEEMKLPSNGLSVNNVIAKEDKYLVYPTEFQHYISKYKDSFQHGGISMEEMIVPVVQLDPKK
jgi:CheY-like chemotaxis protein